MVIALLVLVALLAFANGANDNCKGVATLVGFGAARPRQALLWAAATTALGAVVSFFLAGGLIKGFSTGLFAKDAPLAGNAAFFVAVVAGAFGWVILATRTGMPVSTTHAIVGALTGAGKLSFRRGRSPGQPEQGRAVRPEGPRRVCRPHRLRRAERHVVHVDDVDPPVRRVPQHVQLAEVQADQPAEGPDALALAE